VGRTQARQEGLKQGRKEGGQDSHEVGMMMMHMMEEGCM